jgi:hypothetical protein
LRAEVFSCCLDKDISKLQFLIKKIFLLYFFPQFLVIKTLDPDYCSEYLLNILRCTRYLCNVEPALLALTFLLLGMVFHKDSSGDYLPLLPRGDPSLPRRAPKYSVALMEQQGVQRRVKKSSSFTGKAGLINGSKYYGSSNRSNSSSSSKSPVGQLGQEPRDNVLAAPGQL